MLMLLMLMRLMRMLRMMMMMVYSPQEVKKMDRQPSLCSQMSMMQMRNSLGSTSDTDDVLNQILRGSSTGSSLRKCSQHHHTYYRSTVQLLPSCGCKYFWPFLVKAKFWPSALGYCMSVNLWLSMKHCFLEFKCEIKVSIVWLGRERIWHFLSISKQGIVHQLK